MRDFQEHLVHELPAAVGAYDLVAFVAALAEVEHVLCGAGVSWQSDQARLMASSDHARKTFATGASNVRSMLNSPLSM